MASDDQEVEAWYLEGWCFYLMAEQAKEENKKIEELSWEELARDARECLENCRVARLAVSFVFNINISNSCVLIASYKPRTSRPKAS